MFGVLTKHGTPDEAVRAPSARASALGTALSQQRARHCLEPARSALPRASELDAAGTTRCMRFA
jgi:hypothetical protein